VFAQPSSGILATIDDQCWFPMATDETLVEKLISQHSHNTKFVRPDFNVSEFSIIHYAGRVKYCCNQWLVKNMDPINESVVDLLFNSSSPFIRRLFEDGMLFYLLFIESSVLCSYCPFLFIDECASEPILNIVENSLNNSSQSNARE